MQSSPADVVSMVIDAYKRQVVGYVSYLYYLIYELLSPFIELFGLLTIILAYAVNLINVPFMLLFFLI